MKVMGSLTIARTHANLFEGHLLPDMDSTEKKGKDKGFDTIASPL